MVWIAAGVVCALLLAVWVFSGAVKNSSGGDSKRSGRTRNLDLRELIDRLALTESDVQSISVPEYHEVHIPKSGGGTRRLEIPDARTLAMQRRILHRLLGRLRCHPAAVGFEPGLSIVDAAQPHTNKRIVIRIDIQRFFESTAAERVEQYFRHIGWNDDAVQFLMTMVTWNGHLPQGAATSPRLSNLVNARLDTALQKVAQRFHGDYTRYADDITLSFNFWSGRKARGVVQIVRRALTQAGYRMNGRKTRILRRHQRQHVMGLTVNKEVSISRAKRRQLRAARHRHSLGQEATMSVSELKGWDAFQQMVEQQRSS